MRSWLASLHDGFVALSPKRFAYSRFLMALLIGGTGGYLFYSARLPLPWMLGAMSFCTVAALLGAPIQAPRAIRPAMTMIIGVMLGSGFSPEVIQQLPGWLPTILGLAGFMLAAGATVVLYFRKIGGFDPVTAFFCGMPGGLMEMVVLGEERGADTRTIALVHSARILMIVMSLPFCIQWLLGVSLTRGVSGASVFDAPPSVDFWLLGCGLAGALLGHVLKLPARTMLGAMFVSAAVHVTGLTSFKPPFEIVNAAQLVLGIMIGCRFGGASARTVLRILALSVGSTLILLAWMVVWALIVSQFSHYEIVPLMLAYSPGGLAEMSLIALALHAEVAFVAGHHIIRVMMVMFSAGPIFAGLKLKPSA